ncbi:MAG: polymer-forming cytoskeletal protein [Thiogranum sp.]
MFGVGRKSGCAGIDTVIGAQTRLEGDIHFSGGLHVDGTIKGNLVAEPGTEAVLTVSEQGRIEGDVRVPNLVLNGAVQGDVHISERVELASHARVTGNVYYNLIEMAMGAEVNGNLVHQAEPQRVSSQAERKVEVIEGAETAGMSIAK